MDNSYQKDDEDIQIKGVYRSQSEANKAAESLFDEEYGWLDEESEDTVVDRSLWPAARGENTREKFRSSAGELRFVMADGSGEYRVWVVVEKQPLL